MYKVIRSATNAANISAKPEVVEAAEKDQVDEVFDDKIDVVKENFDYLIDGLYQLDIIDANPILEDVAADINGFISDVAAKLV